MATSGKKTMMSHPWRQDFRDVKSLPDTKVVRTHFLVNFVAVMLLVIMAGLFAFQEYLIYVRAHSLDNVVGAIAAASPADKRNQSDSARFMADVNRIDEAVRFADCSLRPEILIAELAREKLAECRYESMEFSRVSDLFGTGRHVSGLYQSGKLTVDLRSGKKAYEKAVFSRIVITGTMSPGEHQSAPDLIDSFVGRIRDMATWGDVPHGVDLDTSAPSKDMDYFDFSLVIEWVSFNPEAAAK
ncbi:MAG TPA: hypothetical protein PKI32_05700 [Opitutales bacterium]|nr:hypothetical protein [Opitutales bacterium]